MFVRKDYIRNMKQKNDMQRTKAYKKTQKVPPINKLAII